MTPDRDDLVALVCGTPVPFHNDEMLEYVRQGIVTYVGGFHDSASWNVNGLKKLSVEQLRALYTKHKKPQA